MGIFSVTIEMANVHGETFEEVEVIVDTASDYTTVPRQMLERIGVPVTGTAISEMADAVRYPPTPVGPGSDCRATTSIPGSYSGKRARPASWAPSRWRRLRLAVDPEQQTAHDGKRTPLLNQEQPRPSADRFH